MNTYGFFNKKYKTLQQLHVRALQLGCHKTAERIAKQLAYLSVNNSNNKLLDEPPVAA